MIRSHHEWLPPDTVGSSSDTLMFPHIVRDPFPKSRWSAHYELCSSLTYSTLSTLTAIRKLTSDTVSSDGCEARRCPGGGDAARGVARPVTRGMAAVR